MAEPIFDVAKVPLEDPNEPPTVLDPGRRRSYKLNPNFTRLLETSDEDNDAKIEVLERMWRKSPYSM